MNTYVVYCHVNNINNKKYIGITKHSNPNIRWRDGRGYSSYIGKAIEKYGWNNFSHYILEENLSLEEANSKETYYIMLYKTYLSEYGYNLTFGGDTGNQHNYDTVLRIKKGLHDFYNNESESHRLERIKKVSDGTKKAMSRPEFKEEFSKKISASNKSKKHREAVRKAHLGKPFPKLYKKVNQYDLDMNYIQSFDSVKEAALKTGAPNVSACCRHVYKQSGGYIFRFEGDDI